MKKNLVFVLFVLFFSVAVAEAQTSGTTEGRITKNFYLDLGGTLTTFQDTKYSDVRENGVGINFRLGFNHLKSGRHFWEGGFSLDLAMNHAVTYEEGTSTLLYPNVYAKYLKGISEKLYAGLGADLFNNYIRVYPNKSNNSTYATVGSYLYGSVLYRTPLNDKWTFQAMGDLMLLAVQKELPGFAMNYSQNRIEKGGVDYQDEMMGDPSTYQYAEFRWLGNNLILRTDLSFLLKRRWVFGYRWEMRYFATVSGYPTVWGVHNLTVRFNIIHKEK